MDEQIKAEGASQYLQPYKSKGQIFLDNFLGGIAWSFGTLVGFVIIAAIAGFLISRIDLVPIIGSWIAQILSNATSKIQPPGGTIPLGQ